MRFGIKLLTHSTRRDSWPGMKPRKRVVNGRRFTEVVALARLAPRATRYYEQPTRFEFVARPVPCPRDCACEAAPSLHAARAHLRRRSCGGLAGRRRLHHCPAANL